jgi:mRNA-degrading endonuclease HigB of HigAB toxin-antitoxin module
MHADWGRRKQPMWIFPGNLHGSRSNIPVGLLNLVLDTAVPFLGSLHRVTKNGTSNAMKVVGKKRLFDFCAAHPELKRWISVWMVEMEALVLDSPSQLQASFPSVRTAGNMAVFRVAGKNFGLEVMISFALRTVCVRSIRQETESIMGNADVA